MLYCDGKRKSEPMILFFEDGSRYEETVELKGGPLCVRVTVGPVEATAIGNYFSAPAVRPLIIFFCKIIVIAINGMSETTMTALI
jgi:hypothetical protein